MSEKPPKQTREKPLPHAEAYKKFRQEMEVVYPRIEESYKTAQRAVREYQRSARHNKEFPNPKTLSLLKAEIARLKKLKERVDWQLSTTTLFSSAGAPPFRVQRESPRKRGKSIVEHVDTLVLGEKKVGKQKKSLEDPVTTRAMTPTELESFIVSIKTESAFQDPRAALGKEVVIGKPTRGKPRDEIEAFSIHPNTSEEGGGDGVAEPVKGLGGQEGEAENERLSTESPMTVEAAGQNERETERSRFVTEAREKLEKTVGRFALREGFDPYREDEEAIVELKKALNEYLSMLWRNYPHGYLAQTQNLLTIVETFFHEREKNKIDAMTQSLRQYESELEEREIRGSVQERKKKSGWIKAGLFALVAGLGLGGAGKIALDTHREPPQSEKQLDTEERLPRVSFSEVSLSENGPALEQPVPEPEINQLIESVFRQHQTNEERRNAN